MKRRYRWRARMVWALVAFALFVLLCNRWVINSTDAYVYSNFALLPENEVGIVLGTSPYTRDGGPNPQFYGRIQAAAQLYQLGKIKHLIVSGANPDSTYNEPRKMWQELTRAGIPAQAITMDFAGFRTLDSVTRAAEVFNLQRCTIITQKYHAYRAVFIGKKLGLRIAAYVAPAASDGSAGTRHPPREIFARVKAVLDLFVLKTRPKFLGQPEPIRLQPEQSPIEMLPTPPTMAPTQEERT